MLARYTFFYAALFDGIYTHHHAATIICCAFSAECLFTLIIEGSGLSTRPSADYAAAAGASAFTLFSIDADAACAPVLRDAAARCHFDFCRFHAIPRYAAVCR